MAARRLSMRKIKEVLRLKYELGLGMRQIARSCNISHPTVAGYIERFEKSGLSWPLPQEMDDDTLAGLLFPPELKTGDRPLPDMEYIRKELGRKGVTLMLLWEEYKAVYPSGYQYSQFCEHYRRWKKGLQVCMRQEYKAGERMFPSRGSSPSLPACFRNRRTRNSSPFPFAKT